MRSRVASVVALVAVTIAGCSGGSVRFEVETIPFQPWTAHGGAVGDGQLCSSGFRRLVGFADLDGEPLPIAEGWRRFEHLIEQQEAGVPAEEIDAEGFSVLEWTCDDGSGSFVMLDELGGEGDWRITGGTGSYAGVTGEGTGSLEVAGPPDGPDDPAEGTLLRAVLTGSVEIDGGE